MGNIPVICIRLMLYLRICEENAFLIVFLICFRSYNLSCLILLCSTIAELNIKSNISSTVKSFLIYFKLFIIFTADDIEQLNKFSCGGYSDESTIVYLVHPCRILSALEVRNNLFKYSMPCLIFFIFVIFCIPADFGLSCCGLIFNRCQTGLQRVYVDNAQRVWRAWTSRNWICGAWKPIKHRTWSGQFKQLSQSRFTWIINSKSQKQKINTQSASK